MNEPEAREGAKDTGKGALRLSVNVASGSIHDPRERGVINFPFNPEGMHTVDAFVGSERAASLSSLHPFLPSL